MESHCAKRFIAKERTAKLLRYLQHVAEGLAKAHSAGIVHRDLNTRQHMITRDEHAKILDFGFSETRRTACPWDS